MIILGLLMVAAGILIAIAIPAIVSRQEEQHTTEPPPHLERHDRNLIEYRHDIKTLMNSTADVDIYEKLINITNNLAYFQDISDREPTMISSIERFCDRYMPVLETSIRKYNDIHSPDRHQDIKNYILRSLDMLDEAMRNVINSYEDTQSQGIQVDLTALQRMLQISGDVYSKGGNAF